MMTKKEISRNKACFLDNAELLSSIKANIVKAVMTDTLPHTLKCPATFEKSFKRVEDAEKYLARVCTCGINANYLDDDVLGKDAHTVVSTVHNMDDFITCI